MTATATESANSDSSVVVDNIVVTVNPVNDPPDVVNDTNTIFIGNYTAITGNVLSNDSDIENDPLTVFNPGVHVGQYGTLTINNDGSYSYSLNTTNLDAYYAFDEISGTTAFDTAPNGTTADNGSLQGNTNFVSNGIIRGAVYFDGTGDKIDIGNSHDINDKTPDGNPSFTERTISFWFNVDNTIPRQVLFEEGGNTRGLDIYIDNGQLYFGGWNTAESGWAGSFLSVAVLANTWYHATLVLDGTNVVQADAFEAYLNGVSIGTDVGSGLWDHTGDINFGVSEGTIKYHDGSSGATNYYQGYLDDARIYNSVLTQAEIQFLYDIGNGDINDTFVGIYQATDGADPSLAADVTITITKNNHAPIAIDDSQISDVVSASMGTVSGNLLTNDTDPDSDSLQINTPGVYNGVYGDLTVNADGSYSYQFNGDLVSYWHFDGNTLDNAPNGTNNDNGTLQGNAQLLANGIMGSALNLDGTGDYLSIANSTDINILNAGSPPYTEKTLSFWFQSNDTTGRHVIFEQGAQTRGLNIYTEDDDLYVGGWNTPGAESGWAGDWLTIADVVDNNWHHVALTLDHATTTLTMYFDGNFVDSVNTASGLWAHSGAVNIGRSDGNSLYHDGNSAANYYFNGAIDEGRIYNETLSATDIQFLYDITAQNFSENFANIIQVTDGYDTSNFSNVDLTLNTVPPIVLDLTGDGIQFTSLKDSQVYFDVDDDGVKELTAWASANDAILAFDYDHNGIINSVKEIAFTHYDKNAKTDLEGLRAFDSNQNNQFDMDDLLWNDFYLWQDKNQNGISEQEELTHLSDTIINGINLQSNQQSYQQHDVTVFGSSYYYTANGNQFEVADASFTYLEVN